MNNLTRGSSARETRPVGVVETLSAAQAGGRVVYEPGAIKVPVPVVHQPDGASCGAACMLAVLSYFGVGPDDYKVIKQRLRVTRSGTKFSHMVNYANRFRGTHGVRARFKTNMTVGELERHLVAHSPVICSVQSYGHGPGLRELYRDHNKFGHYLVAAGFDEANFYFMDPILIGEYGFIPRAEFVERWHDREGVKDVPDPVHRLGLIFSRRGGRAPVPHRAQKIE